MKLDDIFHTDKREARQLLKSILTRSFPDKEPEFKHLESGDELVEYIEGQLEEPEKNRVAQHFLLWLKIKEMAC